MNWPSWIWKMPASDSPLLFVVLWIYSYNLFVRGLWALLTVRLHYFVVIYITHWIWFGQGSLQTPQLFACTHRDTPLLFIPHPQIDQIQNDCFSNFTDMGRRECASVNLCTLCLYSVCMCQCLSEVKVWCSWGVEVNQRQGVSPSSSALFHQQDRVGSPLHWQKGLGSLRMAARAVGEDKEQGLCSKTCLRHCLSR